MIFEKFNDVYTKIDEFKDTKLAVTEVGRISRYVEDQIRSLRDLVLTTHSKTRTFETQLSSLTSALSSKLDSQTFLTFESKIHQNFVRFPDLDQSEFRLFGHLHKQDEKLVQFFQRENDLEQSMLSKMVAIKG